MAPDLRRKVEANRAARLAQEQELKRLMDAQAGYHFLMFRASPPTVVHPSSYRPRHLSLRSLFGPILGIPERFEIWFRRSREMGRSYSIHTLLHVERLGSRSWRKPVVVLHRPADSQPNYLYLLAARS